MWEHDGVTDLIIKDNKGQQVVDLMLTLETTLSADANTIKLMPRGLLARSQKHYWIQDQQSRITIFTSEMTELSHDKAGTVAIAITRPLRIRILVEDVDTFHDGADQIESYFSTVMADTFFDDDDDENKKSNQYNEKKMVDDVDDVGDDGLGDDGNGDPFVPQ